MEWTRIVNSYRPWTNLEINCRCVFLHDSPPKPRMLRRVTSSKSKEDRSNPGLIQTLASRTTDW